MYAHNNHKTCLYTADFYATCSFCHFLITLMASSNNIHTDWTAFKWPIIYLTAGSALLLSFIPLHPPHKILTLKILIYYCFSLCFLRFHKNVFIQLKTSHIFPYNFNKKITGISKVILTSVTSLVTRTKSKQYFTMTSIY